MRSSIDEALLRTITINPNDQNETPNACSYLDLTVKPDRQSVNTTSAPKPNASTSSIPLANVIPIDSNASHHPCTQVTAAAVTNTVSPSSSLSAQYNQPPICLVAHLSANVNQDLAEADQSIENDATNNENDAINAAAAVDEHGDFVTNNELSNEGAVGGLDSSSTLPDLAKVTTITNNSTSNAASSNCEIDYVDTDL